MNSPAGPDASPQRGRGRPSPSRNPRQRDQLLRAAWQLLSEAPDGDVPLRRIALRAGVTPALAHYYFGNRDGLMTALTDAYLAPDIEALVNAVKARAAQPTSALTIFMQRLTAIAAGENALCRCLLLSTGQPLRQRLRALLVDLVQGAQRGRRLRADLPPDYLADALLGLCLLPLLESRAGSSAKDAATALTLQNVALLQDGIVRTQRPRQDSGS